MSVSQSQVEAAIAEYKDPALDKDLVSAKCIKNIAIEGNKVNIDIQLGFPAKSYETELAQALTEKVSELAGIDNVNVNIDTKIVSHSVQKGVTGIDGVKNIIAVASGKGGVGKSTTAVNIALALSKEGANVAILDADIYGPSQPRMMGIRDAKPETDEEGMHPVLNYGVQTMSIGFLIDEETPMIWRGPMVTQALEQLFKDTKWKEVDYLVVDLPPGTGDVQLTLAQKIPVSGAVVITTPQDIALLDARKGLRMFEKVDVPILGVIENMSIHVCSNCGHEEHIFGEGGGNRMASEEEVHFLGELPLDKSIRELADGGKPTLVADPEGVIAKRYLDISRKITARLSLQAKDYTNKFPTIVIENT